MKLYTNNKINKMNNKMRVRNNKNKMQKQKYNKILIKKIQIHKLQLEDNNLLKKLRLNNQHNDNITTTIIIFINIHDIYHFNGNPKI